MDYWAATARLKTILRILGVILLAKEQIMMVEMRLRNGTGEKNNFYGLSRKCFFFQENTGIIWNVSE
jgi:hypothetical protein